MSDYEWVYGVTNTGQRRHIVRKHRRGYWYTVCHAETIEDAMGVDATLPVCKRCKTENDQVEYMRSIISRATAADDGEGG